MSTRLILTLCASAAVLTACATKQQNPIYKYSTQYKGSSPYTTVASNAGSSANSAATTAATYQTAGQISDVQSAGSTASDYQTVQNMPQTQSTVTYANSAGSNAGYVVPAISEPTRTLKKCSISSGVETCQLVQVPVSAIPSAPQASPTVQNTYQDPYLMTASSIRSSGSLTQVESSCLQAGVSVPCNPQEIPITTQSSVSQPYYSQSDNVVMANTVTAPTDAYYTDTAGGTPGYYAVNGAPAAVIASPATSAYSEPQYVDVLPDDSYAFTTLEEQNPTSSRVVIAATVPSNSLYSDNYTGGYITNGGSSVLHTVVEDDTVYKFSRSTCTSPEEIRSMNGIGSNNYIRLGDTIQLPTSRC